MSAVQVFARCVAALMVAAVLVCLPGCQNAATKPEVVYQTVEVKVPVPVARKPPAALLAAPEIKPPVFVKPTDPKATSALTAQSERDLKILVNDLLTWLDAWRAWATAPDPKPETP